MWDDVNVREMMIVRLGGGGRGKAERCVECLRKKIQFLFLYLFYVREKEIFFLCNNVHEKKTFSLSHAFS
jgi:hypothetical protein